MHKHDGLRSLTGRHEDRLLIAKGVTEDHSRRGEIAEYEFVALLGDGWCGRDIDDEGNSLLLGHLGNGGGLTRVEGANQQLRTFPDQAIGARACRLDVGFGMPVNDGKARQADVLQDARGDLDAALAILTNACLHTRPRQQDADFEAGAPGPGDSEGCHSRDNPGPQALGDAAPVEASTASLNAPAHARSPSGDAVFSLSGEYMS